MSQPAIPDTDVPELTADCARCEALCCVGLAFDASDLFAFDKPAGTPCRHLGGDNRCAIHDDLAAQGFGGCARYDCLGAGQRVSQELFPGRSWRDGPQTARAMFDALRALRRVHECLLLLRTAARLPLSAGQERQRAMLESELLPPGGWTESALGEMERGDLPARIETFLTGLRDIAPRPAEREDARHAGAA